MHITESKTLTRSWGSEEVVVWTPTHAGKILRRNAGTKGGFQCHVKEESHYLYTGELHLETIEDGEIKSTRVIAGQGWTVPPFTFHRETALTVCVLFEVSDPTRDDRYGLIPDALPNMTDEEAVAKLTELAAALKDRRVDCLLRAAEIAKRGLTSLIPTVVVDA